MILVLGDYFWDIYHIGQVRGLSAEAPIPIVDVTKSTKIFPGGVGNVYENLKALTPAIQHVYPRTPYPNKHRLITEDNLQLARWDEDDRCSEVTIDDIVKATNGVAPDAVVIADYKKGSITQGIIKFLINSNVPLYVDTKGNPFDWIAGVDRITLFPNRSEYKRWEDQYNWFPRVLLKQSEEGLAWMEYGRIVLSQPALASKVVSVNGAGDTVLAAFVATETSGGTIQESMRVASIAAGVVVEKPFTATATLDEVAQKFYGINSNNFQTNLMSRA